MYVSFTNINFCMIFSSARNINMSLSMLFAHEIKCIKLHMVVSAYWMKHTFAS